jgi:hypothetical protein
MVLDTLSKSIVSYWVKSSATEDKNVKYISRNPKTALSVNTTLLLLLLLLLILLTPAMDCKYEWNSSTVGPPTRRNVLLFDEDDDDAPAAVAAGRFFFAD